MIAYLGLAGIPSAPVLDPVVTIGFFDGLHLGHGKILDALRGWGAASGGRSVVITFDRHPREVLGGSPSTAVAALEARLILLARAGVDAVLVLPFDRELASWSPEEFARRVIREALGGRRLLLGFDGAFGRGRAGTYDYLKAREAALGIEVRRAEPFFLEGARVSSTLVRQAIAAGDLGRLEALLGRPYSVIGEVRTGDRRGSTLGFPTANLLLPPRSLPPPGVYFAEAASLPPLELRGDVVEIEPLEPPFLRAVTNVGRRPTFGSDGEIIAETHVLDFRGDLYGRTLEVRFLARLRDEKRFPGPGELMEQIRKDVEARRSFGT